MSVSLSDVGHPAQPFAETHVSDVLAIDEALEHLAAQDEQRAGC